jgi:hypothetical protein
VLCFFSLLVTSDEDVLARLESAHGEGIVNLKTKQRWSSKFRNRKTKLDDGPRPGGSDETKIVGDKNHD